MTGMRNCSFHTVALARGMWLFININIPKPINNSQNDLMIHKDHKL